MFKKVSLFTFILLFTFVSVTFAHTGLVSSNPQNGEVINEELEQITLTFEGKVEQGSTFTLKIQMVNQSLLTTLPSLKMY